MKKLCLTILLTTSTLLNCFAGDDFSAVAEIKKRKLVVVLLEENAEIIDKLKKEGKTAEIEAYKKNIDKDNEVTKLSFERFWKETPVEFITELKVKELKQADFVNMTLISHEAASIEKMEFLMYDVCLGHEEAGKKGKVSFELYHKFFKVSTESQTPSSADLLLLLHKIRVYFEFEKEFDLGTLNTVLAKKTLLIDKASTEISNEDIKDAYEFPFRLVSTEEIMESKNSMDKSTVYLKLDVFKNEGQQVFLLVDSETGKILSRSLMGGISKVTINMPTSRGFDGIGQLTFPDVNPAFRRCSNCGIIGSEIFRLYTARAVLKKSVLKVLGSQKIQNSKMFSVGLIPN